MTNERKPSKDGYKQMLVKDGLYTSCKVGEDDYMNLSSKWKELRDQRLAKDDYRCKRCKTAKQLRIHHIRYPEVWGEESVDDLVTLCDDCHSQIHS